MPWFVSSDLMQLLWLAAELQRDGLSVDDSRDELANLIFYRWVDEEASSNRSFRDLVFPRQAQRYRWNAAMRGRPEAFAAFLHDEVYPYLGSLDRVAPDVAQFFRFVRRGPTAPWLRELAQLVEGVRLRGLDPDEVDRFIDGLLPFDARGPSLRTQESIRRLMVTLLEPPPGARVLDLACGTGGLLHEVAARLRAAGGQPRSLVGVEIQPTPLKFARLRFALSGLGVPSLRLADALAPEPAVDPAAEKFDVVLCDPPLGTATRSAPTRRFETPTRNSELLFLQLAMEALPLDGRAAMLVTPSLFHGAGPARAVREALFELYLPTAVLRLPRGAVPGANIEPYLIVFGMTDTPTRSERRVLYNRAGEAESIEAYCERATTLWHKRGDALRDPLATWLDLRALRSSDYDPDRLRGRSHQEHVVAPSLDSTRARIEESVDVVTRSLRALQRLERVSARPAALGDLLERTRGEHFESSDAWLLTLNQVQAHSGRILEKRRGDSSRGHTTGLIPFEKGDLLFSRLNPQLGKCFVADERGYCVSDIVPFRIKEERIDPQYLAWVLRSPAFEEQARAVASGATLVRISTENLLSLVVPVPKPADQQRVVATLDAVNACIEGGQRLAESATDLRSAAFSQLLGGEDL